MSDDADDTDRMCCFMKKRTCPVRAVTDTKT